MSTASRCANTARHSITTNVGRQHNTALDTSARAGHRKTRCAYDTTQDDATRRTTRHDTTPRHTTRDTKNKATSTWHTAYGTGQSTQHTPLTIQERVTGSQSFILFSKTCSRFSFGRGVVGAARRRCAEAVVLTFENVFCWIHFYPEESERSFLAAT